MNPFMNRFGGNNWYQQMQQPRFNNQAMQNPMQNMMQNPSQIQSMMQNQMQNPMGGMGQNMMQNPAMNLGFGGMQELIQQAQNQMQNYQPVQPYRPEPLMPSQAPQVQQQVQPEKKRIGSMLRALSGAMG